MTETRRRPKDGAPSVISGKNEKHEKNEKNRDARRRRGVFPAALSRASLASGRAAEPEAPRRTDRFVVMMIPPSTRRRDATLTRARKHSSLGASRTRVADERVRGKTCMQCFEHLSRVRPSMGADSDSVIRFRGQKETRSRSISGVSLSNDREIRDHARSVGFQTRHGIFRRSFSELTETQPRL